MTLATDLAHVLQEAWEINPQPLPALRRSQGAAQQRHGAPGAHPRSKLYRFEEPLNAKTLTKHGKTMVKPWKNHGKTM